MRRRVSLLLAALLAASTLVLGPAQPASALITCTGTGTMTVAPGLLFPWLSGILGQPAKDHAIDILIGGANFPHGFTMGMPGGACVHLRVPPTIGPGTGGGLLKGFCTHAAGVGTLNGQPFTFLHVGIFLFLTGHIIGFGTIGALPLTGSCLHVEGPPPTNAANPFRLATGGATAFTFALATAVGFNCTNALPSIEILTRNPPVNLLVPPVGIHVDYGLHFYAMGTCTSPDVFL